MEFDIKKVVISKMNLDDLSEISNHLQDDFDDFWTYDILKDELNCNNSTYFVVKTAGIGENLILAFGGFKTILDEAELMNIVVHKSYRNKGIATLLLKHIISELEKQKIATIHLEVAENNIPAIKLYEKFGFSKTSIRKGYYKNQDAILMSICPFGCPFGDGPFLDIR